MFCSVRPDGQYALSMACLPVNVLGHLFWQIIIVQSNFKKLFWPKKKKKIQTELNNH